MHKILTHYEGAGRTEIPRDFGILELFECDVCGCVVSDPDLHMDYSHPEPGEEEKVVVNLGASSPMLEKP